MKKREIILEAIKEIGRPCTCSDIFNITGLNSYEQTYSLRILEKQGKIERNILNPNVRDSNKKSTYSLIS